MEGEMEWGLLIIVLAAAWALDRRFEEMDARLNRRGRYSDLD